MSEPPISDNPSFKKLREQAQQLRVFRQVLPFLRPALRLFKVDVAKIDEALSTIEEL